MRNRLLPVAIAVIIPVALGYFIFSSTERLPLVKTEEVAVMQINSPPGQVQQNITDKQKIAPIVRYYNRAKILKNGDGTTPNALIELKLFDGRIVSILSLYTDTVTIGIKDKSGYKQYNAKSPELAKYLESIPKK